MLKARAHLQIWPLGVILPLLVSFFVPLELNTHMLKRFFELDARLSSRVRLNEDHGGWWKAAAFFAHSGDSWFWAIGLGLVWLFSKSAWHVRSAVILIGVVVLALLVFAIKFLIRRPRPEGEWGAVYRNTDPHSFPSGHAARAALLALLVVALGPSWFTIVVLLWAPLVCLARVATGLHYLSDVFAGILFGLLAGWGLLVIQPLLMSFFPFLFIPFF